MHFTLWPSHTSNIGGYMDFPWKSFVELVADTKVAVQKTSLEGWSPARFTDNRRSKTAVEAVSAIVLDDDKTGLPFDALKALWADYAGLIHTSFSHTPEHPKYRIVLLTSRDMTADQHERVWTDIRNRAHAKGQTIDEATKDPSRLWFIPAKREGGVYQWCELSGQPIDVDAILQTPAPQPTPPAPPPAKAAAPSDRRKAMAVALGAAWPASNRHQAQLALAGALRNDGWGDGEALEFLCAVCKAAGNENRPKRSATIRDTWARPKGEKVTGWSRLKSFVDPVVVDATRAALHPDAEWVERTERRLAETQVISNSAPTPPKSLFTFETAGLDDPLPPLEYQIDSLVVRGEVVMFVAHGNSLKTWLAFSLALSIASGRPWLGRYEAKRGRVGIIDFESGKYEVKRRLQILGTKGVVPGSLLRCSYPVARLAEAEAWLELAALKLDFIVIDSFNAAMPDIDENDARAALLLQHAGRFAEATGCTVLFVHHARKGTGGDRRESVRGSTAIFAACDRIFEFTDLDKQDGGIVSTTMKPVKDGAGKRPADVRVRLNDSGLEYVDAPVVPKAEDEAEALKKRIIAILKQHPAGVSRETIVGALQGTKTTLRKTVNAALANLILAGFVVEHHIGKQKLVALNHAVEI